MNNGFFLITGTSRGIGEALAKRLLDGGNTVLGVSRTRSNRLDITGYRHVAFDLSTTTGIGRIMETVDEVVCKQAFEFICLVNNASAVDPVGPVEKCKTLDIETHVRIGLIAPMLLTSMFIRRFSDEKARKKVAFITSGAAFTPIPDESIYCGVKAGLNMFARCVGLEQDSDRYGFEVISIGPGMVDTSMQLAVRSKPGDEFAMADFFRQAFAEGRLQAPNDVAGKICTILGNRYSQGKVVHVSDI